MAGWKRGRRRPLWLIGIAASALAATAAPARPAPDFVRVNSPAGAVEGTADRGVWTFRGIPYAASTAGEARWTPPRPREPWQGVLRAVEFAPDCPAAIPAGAAAESAARQSEDCLYLNIWAPRRHRNQRPSAVMVWIVGSGFQRALPNRPVFDGAALARKGVVVVTFGFRTGLLGYLALPGLTRESSTYASGNYGQLDALAALRWVRANIAAFGGDPDRVTIFGQSAGAETVNLLTASPLAKGLFQRAIQQSGASFGQRQAGPLADAEQAGRRFMLDSFGTDEVAQLRALPLARLLAQLPALRAPPMEPVIDGWFLPRPVRDIYAAGGQTIVPMLIGSNADEAQYDPRLALKAYQARYRDRYGDRAELLLHRFPAADDEAARRAAKHLGTLMLGDLNATLAADHAAKGGAPVFRYRFDHAPPPDAGGRARGAWHGAEYVYVFDNLDKEARDWTARDRELAATLSGYWVNFARTGNPNGPGLPRWDEVGAAPGMLMRFADRTAMSPAPFLSDIAFLDGFFHGPGGIYAAPPDNPR